MDALIGAIAAVPDRFKGRGYNKAKKVQHVDSRTSTAHWAY